jgi:hypothetical protein
MRGAAIGSVGAEIAACLFLTIHVWRPVEARLQCQKSMQGVWNPSSSRSSFRLVESSARRTGPNARSHSFFLRVLRINFCADRCGRNGGCPDARGAIRRLEARQVGAEFARPALSAVIRVASANIFRPTGNDASRCRLQAVVGRDPTIREEQRLFAREHGRSARTSSTLGSCDAHSSARTGRRIECSL